MGRPSIYKCDESYFSKIDTLEKAYCLGFLWADGHNDKRGGLSLTLHKKDEDFLYFLKNQLKSDVPVKDKNGYSLFVINRKKIYLDLLELGMLSNKSSNNLKFPVLSQDLMRKFLLGFFDGDGSIWKKGVNCYAASFTNGLDFLKILKNYLDDVGIVSSDIRFRYSEDNKNSCQLNITGMDNIIKLYHLFYEIPTFHLKRKKDIFENALSSATKMTKHNGVWGDIINKYNSGMKQIDISTQMGIKPSTIRATIQRARKKNIIL